MPKKTPLKRAHERKRDGKARTAQAGEFVREEMDHVRRGKRNARSTKQASSASRRRTNTGAARRGRRAGA